MIEKRRLDYFLLRYVPNAVREEFVNIGLVMTESGGNGGGFAGMHFTRDWRHARCLDPNIDVDVLEALGREIQQRLENTQQRALLLHEMMDSYSGAVQLSSMRHCIAEDPARELKELASRLVEIPATLGTEEGQTHTPKTWGRKWLHASMANAFQSAGVWDFLQKDVSAAPYTNETDKFMFDFGYAFGGEVKLFHAVSMVDVGQETRMFPLRVAKVGPKMAALRKIKPVFTAVVEDRFDEADEKVISVLAFMKAEEIRVARLQEMREIAKTAKMELIA